MIGDLFGAAQDLTFVIDFDIDVVVDFLLPVIVAGVPDGRRMLFGVGQTSSSWRKWSSRGSAAVEAVTQATAKQRTDFDKVRSMRMDFRIG